MDNSATFAYASPDTGLTYDVAYSEVGFKRYDIFLNGKKVQFALSQENVANQVKHYEQPGWDGWTSSVYD